MPEAREEPAMHSEKTSQVVEDLEEGVIRLRFEHLVVVGYRVDYLEQVGRDCLWLL